MPNLLLHGRNQHPNPAPGRNQSSRVLEAYLENRHFRQRRGVRGSSPQGRCVGGQDVGGLRDNSGQYGEGGLGHAISGS